MPIQVCDHCQRVLPGEESVRLEEVSKYKETKKRIAEAEQAWNRTWEKFKPEEALINKIALLGFIVSPISACATIFLVWLVIISESTLGEDSLWTVLAFSCLLISLVCYRYTEVLLPKWNQGIEEAYKLTRSDLLSNYPDHAEVLGIVPEEEKEQSGNGGITST